MNWYKDLTIEEITSEKMQSIAYRNGIEDAVALMRGVPGLRLYIPVYGRKKINRDYIKHNFTGKNILSISVHLGIDQKKIKYLSNNPPGYDKNVFSNNYIQLVVKKCGKDVAERLLKNFGGEYIYVPQDGFSILRRKLIEKRFNGSNSAELALKFNISERQINKIMSEFYASKNTQMELELFK